jgi:hypothetical protein
MNTPDLTPFGTISLGGLITMLERRDSTDSVYFDFCHLVPTSVASYRGYYDHLALDYEAGRSETVAGLLQTLRAAVGGKYDGYKGGTYTMDMETPIWVSAWGESSGTAIVGLADCDYTTVIDTRWVP